MKQKANYLKKKFGQLTVMECVEVSTGSNKGGEWLCKCTCRRLITLYGYQLHSRKSCGCLVRKAAIERGKGNKKTSEEKAITKAYQYYKRNNKNYQLLPKEIWKELSNNSCKFCGEDKEERLIVFMDNEHIPCCHKCKEMVGKNTIEAFNYQVAKIYLNITR